MKWTSSKENLPDDQEETLIRAGGMYHIAVFDKEGQYFQLRSGEKLKVKQILVQWMRLLKP